MIWKLILLCASVSSIFGAPALEQNGNKKDYIMCQVCHVIVRDMQTLVNENATQARVEGYLSDICNRLTANSDTCLKFVQQNMGKVFAKLSDGLDPEHICILLDVCPSNQIEEKVLPPAISNIIPNIINTIPKQLDANPIECDLCKFVVDYLDKKLLNNRSEEAIKEELDKLCNSLPGQLGTVCKSLEPSLIKALTDEFLPDKVCKAIRACSAEDAFSVHKPILSCKQCKKILQGIAGESGGEICIQIAGVCGKTKSQYHHQTSNSVQPQQEQLPTGAAECTLCKFVVTELDVLIQTNKSAANINATIQKICNSLPDQLQGICLVFAPTLLTAIENGLDPNMACTKIKLCTEEVMGDFDVPEEDNKEFNDYELLEKIFKEEVLPEKDSVESGPLCSICKLLIQEIDSYIQQNKSESEINATVYEVCNKLPAPLNTLCTTYAPMIVKDVLAGFNPEQTCDKLKLCTNGTLEFEEMRPKNIEKAVDEVKSGPLCAICKLLVQEIDSYIQQNKSESEINATVYEVCNKLPAPLNTLCTTYAPMIVKDVLAGFDPEQTCDKLKLCTNGTLPLEEFGPELVMEQVEEKASPGCTLCKFLVQEIDMYIAQNKSAAAVNASVYNLCSKLPPPLSTLCTTYAPIIVKDVLAGFDPEKTCEKVKLCTNSSYTMYDEMTADVLMKSIKDHVEASPGCTLCKFIVQEIDVYIAQNKSATAINASVYSLCSKLPAPINTLCTTYAPVIVKDVLAGFNPEQTCEKVKLCTNGSLEMTDESKVELLTKRIAEDHKATPGCVLCKFIVQEIDVYIAQNKSAAAINASLYNLCSKLPAPLNTLCTTYAPVIVKDVVAGFNPEQTCEKVKLCTNSSSIKEKITEEMTEPEDDQASPGCTLCKFLVQQLDLNLALNKTEAAINSTAFTLCSKISGPMNTLCKQIAPIIVMDLVRGFDPTQTCDNVKLCINGSFVPQAKEEIHPNESLMEKNVEADPLCQLCTFVVALLDQYLAENKTKADVNSTVMGICNLLPANLKSSCILFAPQLVNIITNGVAPTDACKQVKLCPTETGVVPYKEITGLSCSQCHGIVEYVLPQKYDEEFGNQICEAACPVSRRRRSMSDYKGLLPRKVQKMEETWRCDLCEFIIQAIDSYLQNNDTSKSLEQYMKDICNYMPQPFKNECLKTVPDIIRELKQGFDKKILCQHYMPDECKNDTVEFIPEEMEVLKDDQDIKNTECELCKHIIKYIDGNLNHDKNQVQMYVNDVCERLPSPTNKSCKSFAAAELEDILMKIIDRILTPEDVCHMITVC